ncbi:GntR family transcriptional regulator [Isoalcanivorax beigongshangi]|uniref:GntR family transcriptional regulator n=1 Tax=Isoalcanivorax beigongshangi TaxID=3238810 RepID=A0ABV4ADQ3_9GAMM
MERPAPPLAEQVRQQLADAILAGQLAPGTRLDEVRLAQRHGVSRTPLRQALQALVSAGLAEHHPRRGVFVCDVSPAQLSAMFEYAADMEALCAQRAAQHMTRAERELLLATHLDAARLLAADDADAYDSANLLFHELLFRGAHNEYLYAAALAARDRVQAYRRAQFQSPERRAASHAEHQHIVLAVVRGDGARAAELLRRHLGNAERSALQQLPSAAGESGASAHCANSTTAGASQPSTALVSATAK